MKKSYTALIALLTMGSIGQAVAADLPPRPQPAPVYVSPAYNWTGFYLGANLGGAWSNGQVTELATGATLGNSRASFIGGGQLGYNYQFSNNFVLGVEWTYDWGGKTTVTNVVPTAARKSPGQRQRRDLADDPCRAFWRRSG